MRTITNLKRKDMEREELLKIANEYAIKNGFEKAKLLESIKSTFFFSAVFSNDELVGLPFLFMIKGDEIKKLPPFAKFSTYA